MTWAPIFLVLVCVFAPFAAAADDAVEYGGQSDAMSGFADPALAPAIAHMSAGDYAAALAIAEPLAAEKNPQAQYLLGYLYAHGFGVAPDLPYAVELYVMAARASQSDAQFALGELALSGDGVQQNIKTAAGWFRLAADQGHVRAKARLGVFYAQGRGVTRDRARALALFEEAGQAGDPQAQRNMAIAYLSGDGVDQSYGQAAQWFEKAAAAGDPISHYNLGLLLQSGRIGVPDHGASARHMRAAAEAGFAPAMVALGLLLHEGEASSGERPADWFERAANEGDPQGRFLYAVALAKGAGRPPDAAGALAQLDILLADSASLVPALAKQARALRGEISKGQLAK